MNTNLLTIVGASSLSGALAGSMIVAGFVNLQDTTPGTPQTGHINVTGTVRAGNLGLGAAPGTNRAQVTAAGTTGGLRVDTNTGVGVLAVTKGVAGQFVTTGATAPNHRAVVADAQAATGVTFGGVFATRTTGAGAGAFARAIGANNTGTGLIAENTAATGKALVARNTGNNNSLEAGTADDSLITKGAIPRHGYGASTAATMVPIAYGVVNQFGAVISGSGSFTVTKVSVGRYDIDLVGVTASTSSTAIVATAFDSIGDEVCTVTFPGSGKDFRIQVFDIGAKALTDSDFHFVAYRAVGLLEPPASLGTPDMGSAKDFEDWQRRDPAAFDRFRRAYLAWEREALATQPTTLPSAP